jgi:Ca2+/Na+ antiporter
LKKLSLTLTKVDTAIFSILSLVVAVFWILPSLYETSVLLLIFFILAGLFIAIYASEKAVKGMEVLGSKLGLTPYVAGVLSSLASNTPELVIGFFAVLAGETEFAIAFIIIATGFNFLMLGILIMLGNGIRKGPITVPEEVIKVEVPIVRVAIVMIGSIFVLGIVLFAQDALEAAKTGNEIIPYLPYEAALISVLVYLFYLYFIIKHNLKENLKNKEGIKEENKEEVHDGAKSNKMMLLLILTLAFVFIFFAGEMISRSVEIFLDLPNNEFHLNQFQLAFIIGAAASIPEHAIALLAVRHEGGIELGMGNLIAGSMQNLLFMTGLVALFSYIGAKLSIPGNSINGIPLIHSTEFGTVPFLLVQFGFSWLILFLIKSSMVDDQKLDSYEGFTITLAQLYVFIIFLQAILGFKLLG